jgi:hypothetical protein
MRSIIRRAEEEEDVVRHTIRLLAPTEQAAGVSLQVLRALSEALLEAAQRSLRLRVEGHSRSQRRLRWLAAATEIDLIGFREDATLLEWEAPALGEAAPELFAQMPAWEWSPRREQSALSLVQEALRDAITGNAESDLLDRGILEAFSGLGRVLHWGFEAVEFDGAMSPENSIRVTRAGLTVVEQLRDETPPSQRVIVTGRLEPWAPGGRGFFLKLASGESLLGLLPSQDPGAFASLFGERVVVDGEARFRPSGAVSVLLASHVQAATPADAGWERVPRPRPRALEDLKPRTPVPPGTNRMERVFGHWPGDETEEELLAALEKMS